MAMASHCRDMQGKGTEVTSIPPDVLRAARGVKRLEVHVKQPSCPADLMSHLTQLTCMCLRGPAIEHLPDNIGQLTGLVELDLSCCEQLKSLPNSIGQLTALTQLDLSRCKHLSSLPDSVGGLAHLRSLALPAAVMQRGLPACVLRLPARCVVSQDGGGHSAVADLIMDERRRVVTQRLLGDRDARRQSLDSLSVVAVLLATAAFVAFSNAPGAFADGELFDAHSDDPGSPIRDSNMAVAVKRVGWIRVFFIADQLAFVLSMSVVLSVLVSAIPQIDDEDDAVNAGRAWLGLAGISIVLFLAVAAGFVAFFAAAIAVYPGGDLLLDVFVPAGLAVFVLLGALVNWAISVYRLFPGWPAAIAYLSQLRQRLLHWSEVGVKPGFRGMDELTKELLDEVRAQGKQLASIAAALHAQRTDAAAADGSAQGQQHGQQLASIVAMLQLAAVAPQQGQLRPGPSHDVSEG
jgi:Domain of unknown function